MILNAEDILNTDLSFIGDWEEHSNWRILGMGNLTDKQKMRRVRRYEKSVSKGKDAQADRRAGRLDKFGIDYTPLGYEYDDEEYDDKDYEDTPSPTPSPVGSQDNPHKLTGFNEQHFPQNGEAEKTVFGMKKNVAIPVLILSGLAVGTGIFLGIRAMVK